jgi:hypothetical protein
MKTPYKPSPLWRQILDPLLVWVAFIAILALWPLVQALWLLGIAGWFIYAVVTRKQTLAKAANARRPASRISAAVWEVQQRRPQPANAIRHTGRRPQRRRP